MVIPLLIGVAIQKYKPEWAKSVKKVCQHLMEVAHITYSVKMCKGIKQLFAGAASVPRVRAHLPHRFRCSHEYVHAQANYDSGCVRVCCGLDFFIR